MTTRKTTTQTRTRNQKRVRANTHLLCSQASAWCRASGKSLMSRSQSSEILDSIMCQVRGLMNTPLTSDTRS